MDSVKYVINVAKNSNMSTKSIAEEKINFNTVDSDMQLIFYLF